MASPRVADRARLSARSPDDRLFAGPAFRNVPPTRNRAAPLGALRRVLDAAERPVGGEPFTHGAPERGVQLPMARPHPGERTGVVVRAGQAEFVTLGERPS